MTFSRYWHVATPLNLQMLHWWRYMTPAIAYMQMAWQVWCVTSWVEWVVLVNQIIWLIDLQLVYKCWKMLKDACTCGDVQIEMPGSGKVSLRNVTNLEQGTPEHDIVIDVSDSDAPVGPLRLSVVDNLLIVHCLERTGFTYIYCLDCHLHVHLHCPRRLCNLKNLVCCWKDPWILDALSLCEHFTACDQDDGSSLWYPSQGPWRGPKPYRAEFLDLNNLKTFCRLVFLKFPKARLWNHQGRIHPTSTLSTLCCFFFSSAFLSTLLR